MIVGGFIAAATAGWVNRSTWRRQQVEARRTELRDGVAEVVGAVAASTALSLRAALSGRSLSAFMASQAAVDRLGAAASVLDILEDGELSAEADELYRLPLISTC